MYNSKTIIYQKRQFTRNRTSIALGRENGIHVHVPVKIYDNTCNLFYLLKEKDCKWHFTVQCSMSGVKNEFFPSLQLAITSTLGPFLGPNGIKEGVKNLMSPDHVKMGMKLKVYMYTGTLSWHSHRTPGIFQKGQKGQKWYL